MDTCQTCTLTADGRCEPVAGELPRCLLRALFGKHPQPHTLDQIRVLTEWIEAQETAFTTLQANAAAGRLLGRLPSYPTTYKHVQGLRQLGTVREMHAQGAKTHLWLHVSRVTAPPA